MEKDHANIYRDSSESPTDAQGYRHGSVDNKYEVCSALRIAQHIVANVVRRLEEVRSLTKLLISTEISKPQKTMDTSLEVSSHDIFSSSLLAAQLVLVSSWVLVVLSALVVPSRSFSVTPLSASQSSP